MATEPTPSSVDATAELPQPGEVVAGRYRVERELGAGGMGAVFAACDDATGGWVALKIMLPQESGRRDSARRFTREARAARAIDNEHVARVHDVGALDNGLPYQVLELLEGEPFDAVARKRAPLPVEQAVDYLLQAIEGVAAAHALGLVHRDIKPSNLFLTRQADGAERVKVLDFGIAKATFKLDGQTEGISLTESSSLLGSPKYMSPEQLRSAKNVDARTDIWSLGLILHKLVSGKVAFEADNVGEHFAMIVSEPPTRLRQHRPDAPEALEQIILCCLRKKVWERYQDVGQLAVALEPFASQAGRVHIPRIREILDQAGASSASLPGQLPPGEVDVDGPTEIDSTSGLIEGDGGGTTRAWDASSHSRRPARPGPILWVGAAALAVGGLAAGVYSLLSAPAAGTETASAASAAVRAEGLDDSSAEPEVEADEPPTAAPDDSVQVALELSPPDAQVTVDGENTTDNPLLLPQGDRTHTIVVSAAGYVPQKHTVRAARSTELKVSLRRPGRVAGSRPPAGTPTSKSTAAAAPPPPPTAPATSSPAIKFKGPVVDQL